MTQTRHVIQETWTLHHIQIQLLTFIPPFDLNLLMLTLVTLPLQLSDIRYWTYVIFRLIRNCSTVHNHWNICRLLYGILWKLSVHGKHSSITTIENTRQRTSSVPKKTFRSYNVKWSPFFSHHSHTCLSDMANIGLSDFLYSTSSYSLT